MPLDKCRFKIRFKYLLSLVHLHAFANLICLFWLCACFIFACHPLAAWHFVFVFGPKFSFDVQYGRADSYRTATTSTLPDDCKRADGVAKVFAWHFQLISIFIFPFLASRRIGILKIEFIWFKLNERLICIFLLVSSIAGSQTVGRPSRRRRARMTWTIWNRNWTSMTIKSPSRSCTNDSEPTRRP